MGSANSQPQKPIYAAQADELHKLEQKFVEGIVQAKDAQEQVRAPFDIMREMQRPCVQMLTGMMKTINNFPVEARQDFKNCITEFDTLLKATMKHCVALKDVVDEQTSAISNIDKLKRLANEHGRAVVRNQTFKIFAEKAWINLKKSSQKTDENYPVTQSLIERYKAVGKKFGSLQNVMAKQSEHKQRQTETFFIGAAAVLAIGTVVCFVLAAVVPSAAAVGAGKIFGAATVLVGCSAGTVMMAGACQKSLPFIEENLLKLAAGADTAARLLEVLNKDCKNAQNSGLHVEESLSGSDGMLDLNVLFSNLQEGNDMMDRLDRYKKSMQELRTSIEKLEDESKKNYMTMVAF